MYNYYKYTRRLHSLLYNTYSDVLYKYYLFHYCSLNFPYSVSFTTANSIFCVYFYPWCVLSVKKQKVLMLHYFCRSLCLCCFANVHYSLNFSLSKQFKFQFSSSLSFVQIMEQERFQQSQTETQQKHSVKEYKNTEVYADPLAFRKEPLTMQLTPSQLLFKDRALCLISASFKKNKCIF